MNHLILIRRDIRAIKSYLFQPNSIHDWRKIILLYNIYLLYTHCHLLYCFYTMLHVHHNIKCIFLFLYIFNSLRNYYICFIGNIAKIDYFLANRFYENMQFF